MLINKYRTELMRSQMYENFNGDILNYDLEKYNFPAMGFEKDSRTLSTSYRS